jgi:DNA-binding winged helix-turn-helix (wHTH) protein
MRYAFANCRLDTQTRELTRDGAGVHLSPKAYELLRTLIEHRPRVMTKQELMDQLWPDTFVVEANLHVLIGELRSALVEPSARTGSIKTHHGIGYSFAADVRESRSRPRTAERQRSRIALAVGRRRLSLCAGSHQVGRDQECDVVLDDVSVSRRHARLLVSGATLVVEDYDSKNGTLVNGARIDKPTAVVDGDEVTFGSVKTTIQIARTVDPSTVTLTD